MLRILNLSVLILWSVFTTVIMTDDALSATKNFSKEQAELNGESLVGEKLFQTKCSVCHGSEGAGGVGVPLNLYDFLKTSSNDYLYQTIRLGRPGRVMPAFTTLSDEQVYSIIAYIRSWEPDIKAPTYSMEPIHGDKEKGLQLYGENCAECHRDNGIGGKGTGVTYSRPRNADIIAPAIGHPAFLASASDQMIKRIIMTGRKTTPMISSKKMGLTEEDVNNIVSYIRSLADSNKREQTDTTKKESVLMFESSYSIKETIENIKQAALGYNFRYIREQTLNHGFVEPDQESNEEYLVYFCNFTFLNQALSADPRIGMFLPFRATIVKKDDAVYVMTVNPNYLCSLFNNDELKQSCGFMSEKYEAMLEESTL